jgi:uncharacterized protein YyaL (SSP411 family)
MLWLARAQDATPDEGIAQAYFMKERKWNASYPETTGYIIPTFFDYTKRSGNTEFYERALRMANWESSIQLPDGGIQASTIDAVHVVPTVFNTGMVIFGWIRSYEETQNIVYLKSALRAANWLISVQDDDGAWRKYGSIVTSNSVNTYNTRVAWALLEVHRATGENKFLKSARQNIEWALSQQLPNGWLENNCLLDNTQPYTHTIAYAMRGLLEAGAYLKNERYIEAAEKIFQAIQGHVKKNGFLAGRFDRNWRPTVSYCCLTGNTQLGLNGFRLYQVTNEKKYLIPAKKLIKFVLHTQDIRTSDLNIRGGIAGSYPFSGKYHPYQYPNWAAKFTADAILQWVEVDNEKRIS